MREDLTRRGFFGGIVGVLVAGVAAFKRPVRVMVPSRRFGIRVQVSRAEMEAAVSRDLDRIWFSKIQDPNSWAPRPISLHFSPDGWERYDPPRLLGGGR